MTKIGNCNFCGKNNCLVRWWMTPEDDKEMPNTDWYHCEQCWSLFKADVGMPEFNQGEENGSENPRTVD